MKTKHRKELANNLLNRLIDINNDADNLFSSISPDKQSNTIQAIRLRLAAVEHQTSLLRLIQAEDRLVHNLWKLGIGGAGVLVGWLLRPFV